MKKYVLIKIDSTFYDGHGDGDDGGTILNVEHTDKYNMLNFSNVFTDNGFTEIEEDDDDDMSCEDGYNLQVKYYTYKEITEDEFHKFKQIIDDYNLLITTI